MRGSRYVLAALLALTACGNDDTSDPTVSAAPRSQAATTPAPSQRAVEHTLREAAIAAETYYSDTGTYAGLTPAKLAEQGLAPDPGVTVAVVSSTKTAYCLSATGGGTTLYYSTTVGNVSRTACS